MLPNLVYIGPDKAGSTWLFRLLEWHPETYVTPAKDLYFFDRYFDRGLGWYAKQFDPLSQHKVIAEISHDYLYSKDAAKRLSESLPDAKLMVCLREPVDRAFSAYLYLLKHGLYSGDFEAALEDVDELRRNGRYGSHLAEYLEHVDRQQIIVTVFDDLKNDSQLFADTVLKRIGVSPRELPNELRAKMLAAGKARSLLVAKLVKRGAWIARDLGLSKLVGRVKGSRAVDRMLYSAFDETERPKPAETTARDLRHYFYEEVRRVDEIFSLDLTKRWGYQQETQSQVML